MGLFRKDVHKIYNLYLIERLYCYKLMQPPNIVVTGHQIVVEKGTIAHKPGHAKFFMRVEPPIGRKDYMVDGNSVYEVTCKIDKFLRKDGYAVGKIIDHSYTWTNEFY